MQYTTHRQIKQSIWEQQVGVLKQKATVVRKSITVTEVTAMLGFLMVAAIEKLGYIDIIQ